MVFRIRKLWPNFLVISPVTGIQSSRRFLIHPSFKKKKATFYSLYLYFFSFNLNLITLKLIDSKYIIFIILLSSYIYIIDLLLYF